MGRRDFGRYDDEDYDDLDEVRVSSSRSRSGPRKRRRQSRGSSRIEREAHNKMAAGICGILIGAFGVHKFILGMTTPGLIMLLVTLLTCGLGGMVMGPIGLIEGIMYLTKSDEEFVELYVDSQKEWF